MVTTQADASHQSRQAVEPLCAVVGSDVTVPCLDGVERRYRDLDASASTAASVRVAQRVSEALPLYSSVHRGTGYKSRLTTEAFEEARARTLEFAGRDSPSRDDVVIMCRNTTEAINHLAYRLSFQPDDVVVTTVAEHHANLLPWQRYARLRWVECERDGTFTADAVITELDRGTRPKLLAISGATNVTGWLPPVEQVAGAAKERGIPVFVDGAQLAPHRPMPTTPDFIAFSGHKLHAPYGAGALIGPAEVFRHGDPFLAGGGAVDLVDLDEVLWTSPPEREEAGSPNVLGVIAMGEALVEHADIGWDAIIEHERILSRRLRSGLTEIAGVRLLGPPLEVETLPVATFTVENVHHALVAARLSAEFGIGVRHGCFCAHPYLLRLLGVTEAEGAAFRQQIRQGIRGSIPGATRASCGLSTGLEDIEVFLEAMRVVAGGSPLPVPYEQDPITGDYRPVPGPTWWGDESNASGGCSKN